MIGSLLSALCKRPVLYFLHQAKILTVRHAHGELTHTRSTLHISCFETALLLCCSCASVIPARVTVMQIVCRHVLSVLCAVVVFHFY
jgi:hypothetical protein